MGTAATADVKQASTAAARPASGNATAPVASRKTEAPPNLKEGSGGVAPVKNAPVVGTAPVGASSKLPEKKTEVKIEANKKEKELKTAIP